MFDQNSVKCIEYLYLLTLFKSTQYVVPEAKKFFLWRMNVKCFDLILK